MRKKGAKIAKYQAKNGHQMLPITSERCLNSYLQLYVRDKLTNVPKKGKNAQKWGKNGEISG